MIGNFWVYLWLHKICDSCETNDQRSSAYRLIRIAEKNKKITEDEKCNLCGYLYRSVRGT